MVFGIALTKFLGRTTSNLRVRTLKPVKPSRLLQLDNIACFVNCQLFHALQDGMGFHHRKRHPTLTNPPQTGTRPLLSHLHYHPKAQVVVGIPRRIPVPCSRSALDSLDQIASTSVDSLFAHGWSLGISDISGGVVAVPVRAPFPQVAVHVVEPPIVWFFLTNRMGRVAVGDQSQRILLDVAFCFSKLLFRIDRL